jgi:hypothetical protein
MRDQHPPDVRVEPSPHVMTHDVVPTHPVTVHDPEHVTLQVPAFVQSTVPSPMVTSQRLLPEQS